jgi:peptidoglycan/xylan/chitin deacetylase (PgdA/CDA1 family)
MDKSSKKNKIKFFLTVDTEADNQWSGKGDSVENINVLPRLRKLCEKYNVIPTYFVTYEVVSDEKACRMLKGWQDAGKAEIGAHLHPWTTPPFLPEEKKGDGRVQYFPSELSQNVLEEKIKNLTDIISKNLGKKPTSFRAGRWGFNDSVGRALVRNGYVVDSSISPRVNWNSVVRDADGRTLPDFRNESLAPSKLEYVIDGIKKTLLEVPMTIVHTGLFSESSVAVRVFSLLPESLLKRVLNKTIYRLKWCRIFGSSTENDLRDVYNAVVKNGVPALVFMIHSSELLAGGSPYAKDAEAVEGIYDKLETFLSFLNHKFVESVGISEIVYTEGT